MRKYTKLSSNRIIIGTIFRQKMRRNRTEYEEIYRGVHLRIERKGLPSGRVQLRFETCGRAEHLYGYAIVHPDKNLSGIVREIQRRIHNIERLGDYHHRSLYSVRGSVQPAESFVLFRHKGSGR